MCQKKPSSQKSVMLAQLQETHSDDEDGIPPEFADLYKDKELTQTLIDLIHTAADLDILDFEVCSICDDKSCRKEKEGGQSGRQKRTPSK